LLETTKIQKKTMEWTDDYKNKGIDDENGSK
jgi:hypothetical protein